MANTLAIIPAGAMGSPIARRVRTSLRSVNSLTFCFIPTDLRNQQQMATISRKHLWGLTTISDRLLAHESPVPTSNPSPIP